VAPSQERGIPLVLIAATRDEAAAVDSEGVACVLVERDPALPTQLLRVLQALAHGERPIIVAPRMTVERRRQHLVPPRIARQFADTPLSRRELDVLWLDYQGLGMAAIAGALQIEKSTVTSHWKHIQRKLGTERAAVKAWVRARLDGGQERMVGECWRSATIETAHHWHP
jgi:DNA-binding NarL/FixJ family response regulator